MQYALLFYVQPDNLVETLPAADRDAWLAQMRAWHGEVVKAGVFRTGLRLAGAEAAASLRRQGSKVLVTDGPFAETKEILTGLVVIECVSLEEAHAWAKRCPILLRGTVEVRPEFTASA
ncbi:MAG TPA: YciI family protein [Myxococcota bacterium]|nr:YciI family protein [Myxococcota bacterium]